MKFTPASFNLTRAARRIAAIDADKIGNVIRRALSSAGILGPNREIPPVPQGDELVHESPRHIPKAKPGQFVSRSYSNTAGTRAYKLYIPKNYTDTCVPLVVMLHGCTQNPDDFAAGTRMNELADQHGFLVVYPAQSATANGSNCWNWFNAKDQKRDRGEPSLIAGITREVALTYRVDEQRIFVAGLSAGAAMAVILGATYPELFAAVGAHSGLPYGAAHDMPSAFAAMHGNSGSFSNIPSVISRNSKRCTAMTHSIPTIVFHGDHDTTVTASNGFEIVDHAISFGAGLDGPLRKTAQERKSANGREYTVTIYRGAGTGPVVEQWVLHGAGHSWSGGCSNGSFTDVRGPDASAEMVRFFLAQRKDS
jgi:poly(hydroxyalkanoate) depolymerase family esterase